MKERILTLDAGTTGLKCSLFDTDGELVDSEVSPYGVDYPAEGCAQQSVEVILRAAAGAARSVVSRTGAEGIAVIGLSGTMNGCIPLDKKGHALHPNIIHSDTRAGCQLEEIRAALPDESYYAITGNRPDVHYTLPKLLWLREERPEIYAKTKKVVNTKDAIYGFLTGIHGLTDYSDASLTGVFDLSHRRWEEGLLAELGLKPSMMPEVRASHDSSGRLTGSAARLLGLPEGIPVVIGAGDGSCATRGAGISGSGQGYCNLGSSAWLAMLSSAPVIDTEMRVFNFIDMDGQHNTVCGTVQSGAAALDWAVQKLLLGKEGLVGGDYEALEDLAAEAPAGSGGVFFLPTLMGERTPWWDPDARGALIGMTLRSTRAETVRAVYEGITQALHQCACVMNENDLGFSSLSLIGGGAQSTLWPQLFADAFGVPVTLPKSPRMATSLGAAAAAGVGVGIFHDYSEASRIARLETRLEFSEVQKSRYDRHFEVYSHLYEMLREAYHRIAAYQSQQSGAHL